MSRRLRGAAVMVALLAWAGGAAAWEPITGSRPVWRRAAPYAVHQAGSADLGPMVSEREVRRGMEDWSTPSCSGNRTTYNGTTTTRVGANDGVSMIGWVESGWGHSSNAIGVTGTRFTSSEIVEADMEMNGVHFTWTTSPGSGSTVNVYSIALHEGGHYMGLGHSSDSNATMYYAYSGGVSMLNSDDSAGICALYPGMGREPDCTVTGCPAGQRCVDRMCVAEQMPPPGGGGGGGETGALCAPCTTHAQCGDEDDYCLSYPGDNAYCGQACTADTDCESARCVSLSNGSRQCVRYDGQTPSCTGSGPQPMGCSADTDCAEGERCDTSTGMCIAAGAGTTPLGGACTAHTDCLSGACLNGMCTQSCDWPGTQCPAGFYCDGEATGACGPGVCLPGQAGAGPQGSACLTHTDCATLYCFQGACGVPCNPMTVGACPGGGSCRVGTLPCRGACGNAGSLGDPCDANAQCASNLCANADGRQFCTELCDTSSPCPGGYECVSAGTVSICVPNAEPLGGPCLSNRDCASNICAFEDERNYCTRICDLSTPCPDDMDCVESGTPGVHVCSPQLVQEPPRTSPSPGLFGCAAAGPVGGAGPGAIGLLILFLGVRRRRRGLLPPN